MPNYYRIVDRVPGSYQGVLKSMGVQLMAKSTGEFRPPKKGECYLSGAIVEGYIAPNDLTMPYHIAEIVRVRKVEYWEEVKDGS